MLENANVEQIETIEDFMGNFGITPMTTLRDEGLVSVDVVRQRILDLIKLNIKHFQADDWDDSNKMSKLLVDLDEKKNKSIMTIRLGGKRIYRCNTALLSLTQKIEFLNKFYQAISRGILDKQIVDFCEKEAQLKEVQKEKQRVKRRAKAKARREAKKAKEAEEQKHLPHAA